MYNIYITADKMQKYIWKYPYIWQWAADGFGVSGFILKNVRIKASMQKRFLYIAIRKYDFVEKRAGKAREQKSGKARERKPEKRASRNQKSAQAETRKACKQKSEKRASLKKKNLDFSTFAG